MIPTEQRHRRNLPPDFKCCAGESHRVGNHPWAVQPSGHTTHTTHRTATGRTSGDRYQTARRSTVRVSYSHGVANERATPEETELPPVLQGEVPQVHRFWTLTSRPYPCTVLNGLNGSILFYYLLALVLRHAPSCTFRGRGGATCCGLTVNVKLLFLGEGSHR